MCLWETEGSQKEFCDRQETELCMELWVSEVGKPSEDTGEGFEQEWNREERETIS